MAPNEANAHILLIDMDGTLVDYDSEFAKRWAVMRPDRDDLERIRNRPKFEIEANFPAEVKQDVKAVIAQHGFFQNLQPFEGAIDALFQMDKAGLHVFLCTSPSLFQLEGSASGKYEWVRNWLGPHWMSRIILTRDKTVIDAPVLIDDKPDISGACARPTWKQVVFTQPYNAQKTNMARISQWSQWRDVLKPYYPSIL